MLLIGYTWLAEGETPILVQQLLEEQGRRQPAVIELLGQAYGFRGRWVSKRVRRFSLHFYALRQQFEGATVASLAVDATTLGSLDTLSGVLLSKHPLEETFRAGWAPPQATCGPYGR